MLECLKVVYRKAGELLQQLMEARHEIARLADTYLMTTTLERSSGRTPDAIPCMAELLPGKSTSLLDAAMALATDLSSTSFFDDVEERIDRDVLSSHAGLWSLLRREKPMDVLRIELPKCLLSAVLESLDRIDAASLFFEHQSAMGGAIRRLRQILEQARPRLRCDESREHMLLGVPNSPCGRTLRELVAAQVPGEAVTAVAVPGDVVFCVESTGLSIPTIAEQIIGGEPAFIAGGRRLLTRNDEDWPCLHELAAGLR
jgi:hypothetical protein